MKCSSRHLLFLLSAAVLFMFAFGVPYPKRDDFDEEIHDLLRTGASQENNGQSPSQNTDTSNVQLSDRFCQNSNPCGWAIYNQFTRKVDYYMKGSCKCPANKECLRAEEDVTIAAYVYRCS